MEFEAFQKIPRLSRECTITEKIDGSNGCILITEDGKMLVGSRSRWIAPEQDNFGFASWCVQNRDELMKLGVGRHFGEWWGSGIQRRYGLTEKRFSLFNVSKWADDAVRPACCHVVPTLFNGLFTTDAAQDALRLLEKHGSAAAPEFMQPEGIIIYHHAANLYFKKTLSKDEEWKGKQAAIREGSDKR